MVTDIVHFGRFAPGYKDYSILNIVGESGINVHCWLSGKLGKVHNYFTSSNINLHLGKYDINMIQSLDIPFCILPYRTCSQSGVLIESLKLGFIPFVPDLICFHEFLPKYVFKDLYFLNTQDLLNKFNNIDALSIRQSINYLVNDN